MNAREGLIRLKIVWAAICIATSVFMLYILLHGVESEVFGRMLVGVAVATAALAGLPFVNMPIDARVCIGIIAVWGGLAFAEGPGKWPEGFFIAVVFAGIIYAGCWIARGLFGKKTPN